MLQRTWQTYKQYIVTVAMALLSLAAVFAVGVLAGRIIAGLIFLLSLLSIYLQIQSDRQHDNQMHTLTRDITSLNWMATFDVSKDYSQRSDHRVQQAPPERTQADYPQPLKAPDFERSE